MCKIAGFEKFKMQLSQQPKEIAHSGWCRSIELFKLYNRFFENILIQSLTTLAASIYEIINVEHENRCKIAGFEKFNVQISQEPRGLECRRWWRSIEPFKIYNQYFQKILKNFEKIKKNLKKFFNKKSVVEFKQLYRMQLIIFSLDLPLKSY